MCLLVVFASRRVCFSSCCRCYVMSYSLGWWRLCNCGGNVCSGSRSFNENEHKTCVCFACCCAPDAQSAPDRTVNGRCYRYYSTQMALYCMAWYIIGHGILCGMVWYGNGHGMAWYGAADMAWNGMVWYRACHVISYCIMSCHVMLCHVMSCHVMS